MRIGVVEPLVKGPPLLLAPDGVLLRWPDDSPLPQVGTEYHGATIQLSDPSQKEHLVRLLAGTALERCDAACKLPSRVVKRCYSIGHANTLRRIGRQISKGLRAHISLLIEEGYRIGYRRLLYAVQGRTEADQLKRWNISLGSE